MQRVDLTTAELKEFEATLRRSHEVMVRVTLLDLDWNPLSSVTPRVLDGVVLGDRNGFGEKHGPQRRLSLTLFDPGFALNVDTASPADGTVYYDRLVQVHYSVNVPSLGRWVTIPVFAGPPWELRREDAVVTIEADDASVLGWGEAWKPLTVKKRARKVKAIRRILAERAGFTRFRLPARKGKLAHTVSLGRMERPWVQADQIAASMDLQLLVDGNGYVTARELPESPIWTFRPAVDGQPGGTIIDPVSTDTSREDFANIIVVIGRKPKGAKKRVRYVARAPKVHPHSPHSLAQNGVPYRKVVLIRNDKLRTKRECKKVATRELNDRIRSLTTMTCSILPWPHLEPGDLAEFVATGGDSVIDRVDTYSLPLGVMNAPAMSIGWTGRPRPRPGKVRR